MKKKLFALFLIAALMLCMIPAAFAADVPAYSIDDAPAHRGDCCLTAEVHGLRSD